jgi:NAD(P)-dependent dehydrogenase (short-subunit alcohol dehydrogenase family)
MGRAIVERLLAGGARVAAADVDPGRLAALEADLHAGQGLLTVVADMSETAAIDTALDACEAAFGGPVDGLVNAAGVLGYHRLLDLADDDVDRLLRINARGPMLTTREVARRLVRAGLGGSVVNITSTTAHIASVPQVCAYAASKGALLAFTRAAAVDLARHRIRVNAVAPGWIRTAMSAPIDGDGGADALLRRIPMRRAGEPADVAGGVAWLLGDASEYVTGTTLAIDGGWTAF